MNTLHPVYHAAVACKDYMVGLRRAIHQTPELSYRERSTAHLIKTELDQMGIPWVAVGEYGVVATVEGHHQNAMIALRADMDAPAHPERKRPSVLLLTGSGRDACLWP